MAVQRKRKKAETQAAAVQAVREEAQLAEPVAVDLLLPRWLAVGLWLTIGAFLALAARNLGSEQPAAAAAPILTQPASGGEDEFLATAEDRAILAFYCGPRALARALEHVAQVRGVKEFDRDRTFQHIAKLTIPQAGRGVTLLALKEAVQKMTPLRVEGVRFESGERLAALLGQARGCAAVVHLSPVAGRQVGEVPTGHFVTVMAKPRAEGDKGEARWLWFDPLDGSASREEELSRDDLAKRLDGRSTGHALFLAP
jgi:hypothetical protein